MKKKSGKNKKKSKFSEGNNVQKYQSHIIVGCALKVMMMKYNIKYLFFAYTFVVLGPSLTEDGMEILVSLQFLVELVFEYKRYENSIK